MMEREKQHSCRGSHSDAIKIAPSKFKPKQTIPERKDFQMNTPNTGMHSQETRFTTSESTLNDKIPSEKNQPISWDRESTTSWEDNSESPRTIYKLLHRILDLISTFEMKQDQRTELESLQTGILISPDWETDGPSTQFASLNPNQRKLEHAMCENIKEKSRGPGFNIHFIENAPDQVDPMGDLGTGGLNVPQNSVQGIGQVKYGSGSGADSKDNSLRQIRHWMDQQQLENESSWTEESPIEERTYESILKTTPETMGVPRPKYTGVPNETYTHSIRKPVDESRILTIGLPKKESVGNYKKGNKIVPIIKSSHLAATQLSAITMMQPPGNLKAFSRYKLKKAESNYCSTIKKSSLEKIEESEESAKEI